MGMLVLLIQIVVKELDDFVLCVALPTEWTALLPSKQIQSNALAALEAIDKQLAEEVYDNGCVTGDRVNGLCDGVTGDW